MPIRSRFLFQELCVCLFALGLSGCSKGGSAQFLTDPEALAVTPSNPDMQVGLGGAVVVESGKTLANGYSAQVLLKPDSGSVHASSTGYTMTINPVRPQQ